MSDKPRRNGVGPCKADMFPFAVYGQRFIPQLFAHVRKRHEAFFHNIKRIQQRFGCGGKLHAFPRRSAQALIIVKDGPPVATRMQRFRKTGAPGAARCARSQFPCAFFQPLSFQRYAHEAKKRPVDRHMHKSS